MRMRVSIAATALACAVLATSAAQAEPGKRHDVVTLNFMTYVWQPTTVTATKQIVAAWNASHPSIQVNEIQIDPNTVHDYLVTNFAGFTKQGYLADIRTLRSATLKQSIPKRVWDAVTYGGKITAVPTLLQTYNVFANVDALKAGGIKLPTIKNPWTWTQFRAAAKKLTKNGAFGVGWGLKSPVSVSMSMALNFGGSFFYKQGGSWVVKVGKGETQYLETVHDMIWKDGSIDPAGVGLSGGSVLPAFFAGK